MSLFPNFKNISPGDRVFSASNFNNLQDTVRMLVNVIGQQGNVIVTPSGIFPLNGKNGVKLFQLTEPLYRTTNATANALKWDGEQEEWVEDTDDQVEIYGELSTGYFFNDDKLVAEFFGQRWYARGAGHVFVFGSLDGNLAADGSATLSVKEIVGTASPSDTGENITVYDRVGLDATIASTTEIGATWNEFFQEWQATVGPCA